MLVLVTGGSGSGKSAFAEHAALNLRERRHPGGDLVYLATMDAGDGSAETLERVRRHRESRAGMGFRTVEKPCGACAFLDSVSEGEEFRDAVILLEDIPNLLAAELFGRGSGEEPAGDGRAGQDSSGEPAGDGRAGRNQEEEAELAARIADAVIRASAGGDASRRGSKGERGTDIVAVTGEVASDGLFGSGDGPTDRYVRILGLIGRRLAEEAACVAESVCGIPVFLKGDPRDLRRMEER